MKNWTVELIGINNKNIQNTKEQMQIGKVHLGLPAVTRVTVSENMIASPGSLSNAGCQKLSECVSSTKAKVKSLIIL